MQAYARGQLMTVEEMEYIDRMGYPPVDWKIVGKDKANKEWKLIHRYTGKAVLVAV